MEEFGNYYIERIKEIGRGSFGKVEEILVYNRSKTNSIKYARKIFSPHPAIPTEDIDNFKKRFEIEVECQSRCFHKNVVHVSIHNRLNSPWFIMELAECSLAHELNCDDNREGNLKMTIEQKINIFRQILEGVKYIHDKGYLHRDIKALNILKFPDGAYKLSDFGLVKDINRDSTTLTKIGKPLGTDIYMAPEIREGANYSVKSDIYALGILLDKDLQISELLDPIWKKCIAHRPLERYDSIDEIISELEEFLETPC